MNLRFTPELIFVGLTLFGFATGSFLNVYIYRLAPGAPAGARSLNDPPRSFCPRCMTQLLWWHNIPVLSWFLLRGRCWFCKEAIPARYPTVELLTGLAAGGAYLWLGLSVEAVMFFLVCCAAIVGGGRYVLVLALVLMGCSAAGYSPPHHTPHPQEIVAGYVDPYSWMNDPAEPTVIRALAEEERYASSVLRSFAKLPPARSADQQSIVADSPSLRLGDYDYVIETPNDRPGPRLLRYSAAAPASPPLVMFDLGAVLPFGSRLVLDQVRLHEEHALVATVLREPTTGHGYLFVFTAGVPSPKTFPLDDVFDVAWTSVKSGIAVLRAPTGRPTLLDWQPLDHRPRVELFREGSDDAQLRFQPLPRTGRFGLLIDRPKQVHAIIIHATPQPRIERLPLAGEQSCRGIAISGPVVYWIEEARGGQMSIQRKAGAGHVERLVNAPPGAVLSDLTAVAEGVVWKERVGTRERVLRLDATRRSPEVLYTAPSHTAIHLSPIGSRTSSKDPIQLRIESWTHPTRTEVVQFANGATPARQPPPGESSVQTIDARSRDGTAIPLTLLRPDGEPRGFLLSAYGAYGVYTGPSFSVERRALAAAGVGSAVCHARGGGFNGSAWHEAAIGPTKIRAVEDVIACVQALAMQDGASPIPIVLRGRSAGGLVVARAAQEVPQLLAGVVLDAPFLDPVSTLLNPLHPLTSREFAEWGDPRTKEGFMALRHLSPYAALAIAKHPPYLIFASLFDREVPIAEPLKFTAKLRATSLGHHPVILAVDRASDHVVSASPELFQNREELIARFTLSAVTAQQ